jgi:hypothetical protein
MTLALASDPRPSDTVDDLNVHGGGMAASKPIFARPKKNFARLPAEAGKPASGLPRFGVDNGHSYHLKDLP